MYTSTPEHFQIKGTACWKEVPTTQSSHWGGCLHMPGQGSFVPAVPSYSGILFMEMCIDSWYFPGLSVSGLYPFPHWLSPSTLFLTRVPQCSRMPLSILDLDLARP